MYLFLIEGSLSVSFSHVLLVSMVLPAPATGELTFPNCQSQMQFGKGTAASLQIMSGRIEDLGSEESLLKKESSCRAMKIGAIPQNSEP